MKFLKMTVIQVQYICCDNTRENVTIEKACKQEWLGIKFEYTVPGTPQHNARVTWYFMSIYGKVPAMLNNAKFTALLCKTIWAEVAYSHPTWNSLEAFKLWQQCIFTILLEGSHKCSATYLFTKIWQNLHQHWPWSIPEREIEQSRIALLIFGLCRESCRGKLMPPQSED